MQEKTVLISGKEVRFRSSAAVPRLYRIKFKRDIFKDLSKLEASYKGKTDDGEELLSPGQCHYCPKGHSHSLINASPTETLVYLAVVPEQ